MKVEGEQGEAGRQDDEQSDERVREKGREKGGDG